jgi:tRNA(Ile)-lysidine synthase
MSLFNAVRAFCLEQGLDKTYWIAYSGGLDSHVLLSLFSELKQNIPLRVHAIHINHHISPNANAWMLHAERVCQAYQIDYQAHEILVACEKGESLEEVARSKRYAVFADCLAEGDILLTAHHQDDQAETILLQLLRGAGPKGLAAMPVIKPFARGFHGRPLLSFSRDVLHDYAVSHQLKWIDDESNLATTLTRNFIRHELLSLLKTRWPTVVNTIARSGAHCAEAQVLLEEYVLDDWKKVQGSRENSLSVDGLLQLTPTRQRLVLRTWITRMGYGLPDTKKLNAILQDVLTAAWDRMPLVSWDGVELRRYRDDLFLMPPLAVVDGEQSLLWDLAQPLALPGVGHLQAAPVSGRGLSQQFKQVSVQFRQGGEVVKMLKRGSRTLKNLFNEWDVLPWERDKVPLLFVGGVLVGVVGYFVREDYCAGDKEMGWEIFLG